MACEMVATALVRASREARSLVAAVVVRLVVVLRATLAQAAVEKAVKIVS